MQKLTEEEIQNRLKEFSGWQYNNNSIWKEFKFNSYLDSIDFVQKVGLKAEMIDHHPRMIIDYKKIKIEINTHSVSGITKLDFKLAGMVETLQHKI